MSDIVSAITTFRAEYGCGLVQAKAMWDRHGSLEAMRAAMREGGMVEPDSVRVARLETALRALEAHHVEQNRLKGRDESRSTTLRLIREALK